jgi:protein-S-isoprenylcysteine O-methyltransferase Ste14
MEISSRGFFFRNRRWFLIALALVVFYGFSRHAEPAAERLARWFYGYAAGPGLAFWRRVSYGLAAALLGLGAMWRTWGSAYLGTHVVQDRRVHTERLVADGPYRRTRNPLYFGNMLLVLGLGFLLSPVGWVILVVGMWVLVRLFIRDEEEGFQQKGDESYRAYFAAVPRLFPAWSARIPPAGARPRWLQGFCGEAFLWMLTFIAAAYTITLDPIWLRRYLLWGVVVALLLFLWARVYTRKQAAANPG